MKKPKVPGTTDTTNRAQRRAAERGKNPPEHDDALSDTQAEQQQRKLIEDGTPPDVTSVRAKSSRHGKSTADKWNQ